MSESSTREGAYAIRLALEIPPEFQQLIWPLDHFYDSQKPTVGAILQSMGYVDEDFESHVIFGIKFLLVLIGLRLILMWFGFTAHWPVLDDIIHFCWRTFVSVVQILEDLVRNLAPNF